MPIVHVRGPPTKVALVGAPAGVSFVLGSLVSRALQAKLVIQRFFRFWRCAPAWDVFVFSYCPNLYVLMCVCRLE